MKTQVFKNVLRLVVIGSVCLGTMNAWSQAPTSAPAAAPWLPYGVPQILQLEQAKVGDQTIVAFIQGSGNSYNLNADQLIYLRQQGLSDDVLTAMLRQPKAGVAPASGVSTAVPMPQTAPPMVTDTSAQPYVAPDPASVVYTQPNYYYNSYPYYSGYSYGWPCPVGYISPGWCGWYGGRFYYNRGFGYGGGFVGGGHVGFAGRSFGGGGFAGHSFAGHVGGGGGGGHFGGRR
jgi:hypothetical protein